MLRARICRELTLLGRKRLLLLVLPALTMAASLHAYSPLPAEHMVFPGREVVVRGELAEYLFVFEGILLKLGLEVHKREYARLTGGDPIAVELAAYNDELLAHYRKQSETMPLSDRYTFECASAYDLRSVFTLRYDPERQTLIFHYAYFEDRELAFTEARLDSLVADIEHEISGRLQ